MSKCSLWHQFNSTLSSTVSRLNGIKIDVPVFKATNGTNLKLLIADYAYRHQTVLFSGSCNS